MRIAYCIFRLTSGVLHIPFDVWRIAYSVLRMATFVAYNNTYITHYPYLGLALL